MSFANWKKPAGGGESVEVVGFELPGGLGAPWDVVQGEASLLGIPDTVAVDELYQGKLGIVRLGQEVEVNGHRARVVALTRGIRSFTTSPYVFCSLPIAQTLTARREGGFTYVLVNAAPGYSPAQVRQAIAARVDGVDVYLAKDFAARAQNYWMFTTGAGMALLIAAGLGLVVGVVIVAQTLYATTMDHLGEFGTLRAMGAKNTYIYRIIVIQALVAAVAGYTLGISISFVVVRLASKGGASVLLPWPLATGLFFVTVAMCVGASMISIHKVTSLDPVMVFKGR